MSAATIEVGISVTRSGERELRRFRFDAANLREPTAVRDGEGNETGDYFGIELARAQRMASAALTDAPTARLESDRADLMGICRW